MPEERSLTDVYVALEALRGDVKACSQEIKGCRKDVGRLDVAMSGTNGDPGLKTRVDRLEQSEEHRRNAERRRGKWLFALTMAALGWLGDILKRGLGGGL